MRNNTKTPKSGISEAPNPSKKGPNSAIPAQGNEYIFYHPKKTEDKNILGLGQ